MELSIPRCISILACSVFAANGLNYYVDKVNGNDAANGLSAQTAWKTIAKANERVSPGDSVSIRAGSYGESIAPGASGTEQNRITYSNYRNEKAVICGTERAVRMISRAYVTVRGIVCEDVEYYVLLDSCHDIWIFDCAFDKAKNQGGWPLGILLRYNSHHNRIRNCTIGRVGYVNTANDDRGGVINIGRATDSSDKSHYNLVENNVFFHGGHHIMTISSSYNVIRNNFFHNEEWMDCQRPESNKKCGNRHIIFEEIASNVAWNVIEGNRFAFSGLPPDDNTTAGVSVRTPHNIIRYNVFYQCDGPGLSVATYSSATQDARFNHIYHNVFYHNAYHILHSVEAWKEGGLQLARLGSGKEVTGVSIKNNIFYDNKTTSMVFYYVNRDSQIIANNWEKGDDPLFMSVPGAPDPFDPSQPDFRLRQGSPCIDQGAFLTGIQSPDGAGTQFQVGDAGYFSDGNGIVEGDLIQLASGQQARITGIDYSGGIIKISKNLTWKQHEGIGCPFLGSAPDMGAFEYGETTAMEQTHQTAAARSAASLLVRVTKRGVEIIFEALNRRDLTGSIHDMSGRLILNVTLSRNNKTGLHTWSSRGYRGLFNARGIYIFRLDAEHQFYTRQILLL